jgi:hypothetical protein
MFVQYHNWGNIYKMWNNCENSTGLETFYVYLHTFCL